jgi:hypothetical protein
VSPDTNIFPEVVPAKSLPPATASEEISEGAEEPETQKNEKIMTVRTRDNRHERKFIQASSYR